MFVCFSKCLRQVIHILWSWIVIFVLLNESFPIRTIKSTIKWFYFLSNYFAWFHFYLSIHAIQRIFVGCQTHALDMNRPTVNTWLTPALRIPICSFINWALGQKPGIPGVKRGTRRAPPLVTFAMLGMRAMLTICAFCQDFYEDLISSSCHQQGARVQMFLCGLLRGLFDEGFGLEKILFQNRQ